MSKIVYFTVLSAILLAVVTVINIYGVNAREETKFIQVPVLAQGQADYGVDENANTIPAVSPQIIEDKVHDLESASVKTIEYTTLPAKILGPTDDGNDNSQSVDQPEAEETPVDDTNDVTDQDTDQNVDQNNNGNGNPNQDKNKDKDKDKNKDKDKDKENSHRNDSIKANEKKGDPAKIK